MQRPTHFIRAARAAKPRCAMLMLGLWAGAGCSPSAPTQPTYVRDVRPIFMANCVRCHGQPGRGGASDGFRLDHYSDRFENGKRIRGAQTMAVFAYHRAAVAGDMPNVGPELTGRQKTTLERWSKDPIRGEGAYPAGPPIELVPLAGGQPTLPTMADDRLEVGYFLADTLIAELQLFAAGVVHRRVSVPSGRGSAAWDVRSVPPGTYQLQAVVEGPGQPQMVDLGMVSIAHASGNTAPVALLEQPDMNALYVDQETPQSIDVRVDDFDAGDMLRLTVEAYRPGPNASQVEIIVPLVTDMRVGRGLRHVLIDSRMLDASPAWRIRVRVTDGKATTSVASGPITLVHGTTREDFQSIKPLFENNCLPCHDAFVAGERFDDYADILKVRGRIFQRVAVSGDMPPPSFKMFPTLKPLSKEERARMVEWLSAGAPQ